MPEARDVEGALVAGLAEIEALRNRYAERRYLRPLIADPAAHDLRMVFARSRIESEDHNGAISALTALLDTDLAAEACYLIGYAYAGLKDYASAATHIQKAVELDPENPEFARSLKVIKGVLARQADR